MKIGLWNIDHPETASGKSVKQQRFDRIADYLTKKNCDAYIITEANAALSLKGYFCELSAESPFRASSRFYGSPNTYHQVAIYSKSKGVRTKVDEPINGLRVTVGNDDFALCLYGNVITIKDNRYPAISNLTYTDRLNQQIEAVLKLPLQRTLVAGDFNFRAPVAGAGPKAHKRVKEALGEHGWSWPTEEQGKDTSQHVLHSQDLVVDNFSLDHEMKYKDKSDRAKSTGLSDHPYMEFSVSPASALGQV
jgi:hypothetical protein